MLRRSPWRSTLALWRRSEWGSWFPFVRPNDNCQRIARRAQRKQPDAPAARMALIFTRALSLPAMIGQGASDYCATARARS